MSACWSPFDRLLMMLSTFDHYSIDPVFMLLIFIRYSMTILTDWLSDLVLLFNRYQWLTDDDSWPLIWWPGIPGRLDLMMILIPVTRWNPIWPELLLVIPGIVPLLLMYLLTSVGDVDIDDLLLVFWYLALSTVTGWPPVSIQYILVFIDSVREPLLQ